MKQSTASLKWRWGLDLSSFWLPFFSFCSKTYRMKGKPDTSGGRLSLEVSDLVPNSTGTRTVQELKWRAVGIQQQLRALLCKREERRRWKLVSEGRCLTNWAKQSRWSTGSQSADRGWSFTIQQQSTVSDVKVQHSKHTGFQCVWNWEHHIENTNWFLSWSSLLGRSRPTWERKVYRWTRSWWWRFLSRTTAGCEAAHWNCCQWFLSGFRSRDRSNRCRTGRDCVRSRQTSAWCEPWPVEADAIKNEKSHKCQQHNFSWQKSR